MSREAPNLAVLIDSDNAQAAVISDLLAEVAQVGTATVKRAYGDWTTPQLGSWKEVLNVHAIVPVQQFSYTSGKNATDSALIIDAMDLLHGGRVDGFCLVSSDSDFTRLATRIREQGLLVIGFGERKTPKAFVAACDRFLYTDILRRGSSAGGGRGDGRRPAGDSGEDGAPPLKPFLCEAITAVTQDDGWAPLGMVGSLLQKNDPSFDARNYGFRKLSELVKGQTYLTVKEVPMSPASQQMHLFVQVRGG
ncbi:MAG: NYN domain-containing protein [Prochlorococcaceae cyanobacterium]